MPAQPKNKFLTKIKMTFVPELKAHECSIEFDINGVHYVFSDGALTPSVAFKKAKQKAMERITQILDDQITGAEVEEVK